MTKVVRKITGENAKQIKVFVKKPRPENILILRVKKIPASLLENMRVN